MMPNRFGNFAQSTSMIPPRFVQNLKTIGWWRWMLWMNAITHFVIFRWVFGGILEEPRNVYAMNICIKASDAELWCFPLICTWTKTWANNGGTGDVRLHRAHYDVTVMYQIYPYAATTAGHPVSLLLDVCRPVRVQLCQASPGLFLGPPFTERDWIGHGNMITSIIFVEDRYPPMTCMAPIRSTL